MFTAISLFFSTISSFLRSINTVALTMEDEAIAMREANQLANAEERARVLKELNALKKKLNKS